jgi:3-oxoacyl-[acyl-carrier protein] reductase
MQRYGRLDILVANAGYCAFAPLAQTTDEACERLFAVNPRGTFYCLRERLKHIADGGRIVGVSTIGTVHNLPGRACYFAFNAAVEQYCGVLADTPSDTPQKLRDQTPLAHFGTPSDIAETVAFLVGPSAAWVTRRNLAVDGGITSR